MTISTEFIFSYGAVRIEVEGMTPAPTPNPDGLLVKRGIPAQDAASTDLGPWQLESLRGYDNPDEWPGAGNTSGLAYDFEMPLGMDILYFLVPADVAQADAASGYEYVVQTTPGNLAWLRDPLYPALSQPVVVVSTDPKSRPARQSVFKIAGKKTPVVVWDVREARQGTVQLLVVNAADEIYGQTRRDRMDKLLDSNRPLLLSMCADKDFDPCWMAISNASWTRIGTKAAWTLDLEYQEVDNPIAVGVVIPAEFTYQQGLDAPVAGATYQHWVDTFPSYFDLVEGKVTP